MDLITIKRLCEEEGISIVHSVDEFVNTWFEDDETERQTMIDKYALAAGALDPVKKIMFINKAHPLYSISIYIHELSHYLLKHRYNRSSTQYHKSEIEAEYLAYLLLKHYKLPLRKQMSHSQYISHHFSGLKGEFRGDHPRLRDIKAKVEKEFPLILRRIERVYDRNSNTSSRRSRNI